VRLDIRSLTLEELQQQFSQWQQPAYRAAQLLEWVYARRAASWDEMTNLPKALRAKLAEEYSFKPLELVRVQGVRDETRKFLWRLDDGALVECVLIPANPALYGESSDRHTLCVSTQVGCAYGCKFCASGLDGLKRNLSPDEIVGQWLATERFLAAEQLDERKKAPEPQTPPSAATVGERLVNNLVIMGMGEPLANYENLLKALKILNASWGAKIGARKITISTCGLAPQIRKLAEEPFQFRLAISLHGATNAVRERLMPVNRKYSIEQLADACDYYQEKKGRMITLEYILIAGVNDGLDQVRPLSRLASRLHAKINLIPCNPVEGLPWTRPSEAVQDAFVKTLEQERVSATLRREKGGDIDAACGQLRLKTLGLTLPSSSAALE
jgi:23S rRNA (adenine2503-C2)-methyltransferase